MTYIAGILGCAVLFALWGAMRPRQNCSGGCGGCTIACGARGKEDESHE